jgi:hypothetical protein
MRSKLVAVVLSLVGLAVSAHGAAALFVEEPYGSFGGFTPTGHSAIYLSRVCAETPVKLRLCEPGETGVVISRYHRVGGYDWMAIPLIPYLFAVEDVSEIPASIDAEQVASLRDEYRRAHFSHIIPDGADGGIPAGNWTQLVGSSYDRTIYSFEIETTREQDERLIEALNSRTNKEHFNLLFRNCADFSRNVINFYYPHAIHRGILNDLGIMTPKQAARTLAKYSRKHDDLEFSGTEIPQIEGLARSTRLRGVLESFVKSKKYVVPVAALHPLVLGGIAVFYVAHSFVEAPSPVVKDPPLEPDEIAARLAKADDPPPPPSFSQN